MCSSAARRISGRPISPPQFDLESLAIPGDRDDLADCPGEDDPDADATSLSTTPDNKLLKGTILPGMDMFDSATELMKRIRNQKKDGSMLKRMEKSSEAVEPTEVIYSPTGRELKQRLIDGSIDTSSSPLKGETPVPKRRPSRPRRKALTELSTNFRPNNPPRNRRSVKAGPPSAADNDNPYIGLHNSSSQALPYFVSSSDNGTLSRFTPTEDENLEFQLTVGNMSIMKKKRTFSVFRDQESAEPIATMMPATAPAPAFDTESEMPGLIDILAPRDTAARLAAAAGSHVEFERLLASSDQNTAPRNGGFRAKSKFNDFSRMAASYLPAVPTKEHADHGLNYHVPEGTHVQPVWSSQQTPLNQSAYCNPFNTGHPLQMGFGNFTTHESYGLNPLAANWLNPYQYYDNAFAAATDRTPYGPTTVPDANSSPNNGLSRCRSKEMMGRVFGNGTH